MPQTVHICEAGGRIDNQDAWGHLQLKGSYIWAVADGLGGHGHGALAATITIEAVLKAFSLQQDITQLAQYFEAAQEALLQHQHNFPETADMRTTLSLAVFDGTRVRWAHAGDTRIYFFQLNKITRTLDHSIPQLLVQSGEIKPYEIRTHQDRNRIVRALGNKNMLRYTVSDEFKICKDDILFICTDGFWEYVNGLEIYAEKLKQPTLTDWLHALSSKILSRAPKEHDNYTAVGVVF